MSLSIDEIKDMNAANLKAARARDLGIPIHVGTLDDLMHGMFIGQFTCDQHFGGHWPEDDCVNAIPMGNLARWIEGK